MRRAWVVTLIGMLLVAAVARAEDDVGYGPPSSSAWPPPPTPGLQNPDGSPAYGPQTFPAGLPTATPSQWTAPNPALTAPQGEVLVTPAPAPDGSILDSPPPGPLRLIFDAPSPDWSFSADALFLQRSIGTDRRLGGLYSYNVNHFVEHLDSDDAGFSMQPGMRLQLVRHVDAQVSWQAIYFGLQNWSAGRTLYADPVGANTFAYSPYTQTDAILGGFGTSLGYTDHSSLHNFELNRLFKRVDFADWRWGTLWGFRYFNFSDRLNINGVDDYFQAYENVYMNTLNNLLGLQLGAYWERDWNRFHLQLQGKVGLMANIIHLHESNLNSSGYQTGSPAGFYPYDASATRAGVAGVLDLSALASYQIRPNFLLRAGYQLLYVPGVALSPDQLNGVWRQDGVFLHGPMAGFEARW
jgi:hypothetical protein